MSRCPLYKCPANCGLLSIHGLQFVVGRVFGSVFSSVTGYVVDKVFYGSIFVDNEIYYVDPYRVTSVQSWIQYTYTHHSSLFRIPPQSQWTLPKITQVRSPQKMQLTML